MTERFDPFDTALALWRQLGSGDRCRFIDRCILESGEFIPVPAFMDDEQDAVWWRESQPKTRQSIMFKTIAQGLSPKELRTAIGFLEKLIAEKEAPKAEPPAG